MIGRAIFSPAWRNASGARSLRATQIHNSLEIRSSAFGLVYSLSDQRTSFERAHQRRWQSMHKSVAGDDDSGHIAVQNRDEGLLFLINVFPHKLNFLMHSPLQPLMNLNQTLPRLLGRVDLPERAAAEPDRIAEMTKPSNLDISIEEVIPRVGEGGAFIKYKCSPGQDRQEIEARLKAHLKSNPIRPWFNPFKLARIFVVKGVPWLEDLQRSPSAQLKVEFAPSSPDAPVAELSQETLFSLFRTYGQLRDIKPQPTDSKELPRYAHLYFSKVRYAIMAKNCMHGYRVPPSEGGGSSGTVLKLVYEQSRKGHQFWDWFVNHPRITLPLLVALLGAASCMVFDPIRTFFIRTHIKRQFHISDNKIYKWFSSQTTKATELLNLRYHKRDEAGLQAIWDDRKGIIEQIQTWLMESADTFIVIQGPRGSGKRELLLDQVLKSRKNNLIIDCKAIQEARGDSATIGAAALQVGYRPVFSWMNSISSLIDLAAQGTIGTKTGFSETLDSQLAKIWQSTSTALRSIALEGRTKQDKDAALGEDEYLEAHPEKRPVVIIDNFLHMSQENGIVYDKLAEWAAGLTTSNVAHVIFLTNDVSFSKSLGKALPDRAFRQTSLGDFSPKVAKQFVLNHLDADVAESKGGDGGSSEKDQRPSQTRKDLNELDDSIAILGGRLTDLEFLARRIKSGETPNRAARQIIDQSASEILKMYILDAERSRLWTPEQAWVLIKRLAQTDSLRYNELLLVDEFMKTSPQSSRSGEATLQALEQAELITICSVNGRPHSIKPGKPVYSAAFANLTQDHVLSARLDLAVLGQLIKLETSGIEKAETELDMLGRLPGQPAEIGRRVKYLLNKICIGQDRIEHMEHDGARLKAILKAEY